MNMRSWKIGQAILLAGAMALPGGLTRLMADERPGVVRISDNDSQEPGLVPAQYVAGAVPVAGPAVQPSPGYATEDICYPEGYCGPGSGSLCSILLAHNCFRVWKTKAVIRSGGRVMGKSLAVAGSSMVGHKSYDPVDPGYTDPRDSQVFSAQGYGVPVSVPIAPCVKYQYNYGWGVPSSRLTRINSFYDQYYPNAWTTQAGNEEARAANHPPVIYSPTDTTQFGFYYRRVPTWQPVPSIRGGTPVPLAARFVAAQPGYGYGAAPCPPGALPAQGAPLTPVPQAAPLPSPPTYAAPEAITPPAAKPVTPAAPPVPGAPEEGVEVPEPPK